MDNVKDIVGESIYSLDLDLFVRGFIWKRTADQVVDPIILQVWTPIWEEIDDEH